MKYLIEWFWDLGFCLKLFLTNIRLQVLFINFYFIYNRKTKTSFFGFSVTLPKYALVITNSDNFFYQFKNYSYFRKELFGFTKIYILNVIGGNAERIYEVDNGKNLRWSNKWKDNVK